MTNAQRKKLRIASEAHWANYAQDIRDGNRTMAHVLGVARSMRDGEKHLASLRHIYQQCLGPESPYLEDAITVLQNRIAAQYAFIRDTYPTGLFGALADIDAGSGVLETL